MNLKFWKKKTIIELLNQQLALMTHDERVEHLRAIVPRVCPGAHVSLNPKKRICDDVRERMVSP